jgi:hypothetical protein
VTKQTFWFLPRIRVEADFFCTMLQEKRVAGKIIFILTKPEKWMKLADLKEICRNSRYITSNSL